jgi:hypothetical protein
VWLSVLVGQAAQPILLQMALMAALRLSLLLPLLVAVAVAAAQSIMAVQVAQVAVLLGTQAALVAQELQRKVTMVQHHHLLRVEAVAVAAQARLAQQVQPTAAQVDRV